MAPPKKKSDIYVTGSVPPPPPPPPNGGKSPAEVMAGWEQPPVEGGPVGQPAAPEMQPGVADQILATLRNVEPFKTVLDKILSNTQGANAALQGVAPPPPANLPAPPGLDPTVQALRSGTSGAIPNQ